MRWLADFLLVLGTLIASGCSTIEVASDRPAEVWVLGSYGLEPEGDVAPGAPLRVSRFLPGDAIGVACLAGEDWAYKEVPADSVARFADGDFGPVPEHLANVLEGRIETGMTEQELVWAWGPPRGVRRHHGREGNLTLEYERSGTLYLLVVRDGRLESWTSHELWQWDACWYGGFGWSYAR